MNPAAANPDTQLLLKELQKMSADEATIQKQLTDTNVFLEQRFGGIDKRFEDVNINVGCRILDAELRQDERLKTIEKAATEFEEWRQEQEGVVDDLRLSVNKLNKYWDRSMLESMGATLQPPLILGPPPPLRNTWLLGLAGTAMTTTTRRMSSGWSPP